MTTMLPILRIYALASIYPHRLGQDLYHHRYHTLEEDVREQEANKAKQGCYLDRHALGASPYLLGQIGWFGARLAVVRRAARLSSV